MSQQLLIGILACMYACTVEWKDPSELHRDLQRSRNLGRITCKSHRAYDGGSKWREPEFLPNAQKSIYELCSHQGDVRVAMLFCGLIQHLVLRNKLYHFNLLLISTGKNVFSVGCNE